MKGKNNTFLFFAGLIWFCAAASVSGIFTGMSAASLGAVKGAAAIVTGNLTACLLLFFMRISQMTRRQNTAHTASGTSSFFEASGAVFFAALDILLIIVRLWLSLTQSSAFTAFFCGISDVRIFSIFFCCAAAIPALFLIFPGIRRTLKFFILAACLLLLMIIVFSTFLSKQTTDFPAVGTAGYRTGFWRTAEQAASVPFFWIMIFSNTFGDYEKRYHSPKKAAGICAAAFFAGSCWMNFIGIKSVVLFETPIRYDFISFDHLKIIVFFLALLSFIAASVPAILSAGVSSRVICDKIEERKIAAAVLAAAICLTLCFPAFGRPFAFYRFAGSVLVPMSVICIADTFLSDFIFKTTAAIDPDTRNALNVFLWLTGFLLCRLLYSADLAAGSILPVIPILTAAWIMAHHIAARRPPWTAAETRIRTDIISPLEGQNVHNSNTKDDLKRSGVPDKFACQGRRERLQQAPGAFALPGFGEAIITQPPKVRNGTRRLQKRRTSGACYKSDRAPYVEEESDMNISKQKMRLYAVTDSSHLSQSTLPQAVERAICGGVTLVQLREKNLSDDELLQLAKELKQITDRYAVPLIINDRPDIALQCGAAGVHIGQEDGSIEEARRILGDDKIIGVSAHSVQEAQEAEASGADYLGVGAVFPTSTKKNTIPITPDILRDIKNAVNIPVAAIGGITADKIDSLKNTGIDGAAVVSAIFSEKDQKAAAQQIVKALDKAKIGVSSQTAFSKLKIRGAIFDVDGTILDSMPMWCSVGSRFLKKNGVVPPAGIDEQMVTRTLEESASIFHERYGISGAIPEIVADMIDMVRDDYKYHLGCKPGVHEVIRELYEKHIPLYIATATDRDMITAAFDRLGLSQYFQGIITCGELGVPKTKPDIYFYAAKQLGTSAEETLVFEDVVHAVRSAAQAGFPVVAIYDDDSAEQKEEIKIIADLYLESYSKWPGIHSPDEPPAPTD